MEKDCGAGGRRVVILLSAVFLAASLCSAATSPAIPNIFKPEIDACGFDLWLSMLVLAVTGAIFCGRFSV